MPHQNSSILALAAALTIALTACGPGQGANRAPDASFTATPTTGTLATAFAFDAGASTDPDGTLVSYAWAFGDGGTATGATASHTYAAAGSYTVTLTVTDDDGATDTATRQVTVTDSTAGTPEGFQEAAEGFADDVATVNAALGQSEGFLALQTLPPGSPLPFGPVIVPVGPGEGPFVLADALGTLSHTDGDLPRGTFVYNPDTFTWEGTPTETGTLVLLWTFEDGASTRDAELTIDWEDGSATVVASDGFSTVEVPTAMSLSLTVDGTEVAALDLSASWYASDACGTITEPTGLALSGFVGDASARLEFEVGFSITDNASGDDTVATSGSVTASAGGDSATVEWDLGVAGAITRDDGDCFLDDLTVTSGGVSLGANEQVGSDDASFAFAFDFDEIVLDEFGGLTSVRLSDGSITLDGATVVTFAGAMDDENGNGVPGENVTLVFANGDSTTLEAFLMDLETLGTMLRLKAALHF